MTKNWLRSVAISLLADVNGQNQAASPSPNGTSSAIWKVSPTRILKHAFLNLLEESPDPYPEVGITFTSSKEIGQGVKVLDKE